jgi:hypothetical protein
MTVFNHLICTTVNNNEQGVFLTADVRTLSAGNTEISQEIIVKPHLTWAICYKNTVLCLFHHLLLVNASMHTNAMYMYMK